MILVVSLSPAWDVTYAVPRLTPGQTHRVQSVAHRAGGKGANVSRVLVQLGTKPHLVAPLGGPSAAAFAEELAQASVPVSATPCDHTVRTSVVVTDERNATTFNEPGAALTSDDWDRLVEVVDALLPSADVVVLTGSLPEGAPRDAYAVLVRRARHAETPVLLDAGGAALGSALAAGPDVVKPNVHELEEHCGRALATAEALVDASRDLVEQGAAAVLVSRGDSGLVFVDRSEAFSARLPNRLPGNATGAGDALTAALAHALAAGRPLAEAVVDAVAVAGASVTCRLAGETDLALAEQLRPDVCKEVFAWAS